MKTFYEKQKFSESIKEKLNSNLGPHLANPYYLKELQNIIEEENKRQSQIFNDIDNSQYNLIINEEKLSNEFYIRINNNFEAFVTLFDFMLLDEDFVLMGGLFSLIVDEEYFKERKDYNFLLKLKQQNKPGIDLNSKRAFKKIYPGIDRTQLKINFMEKYRPIIVKIVNSNFTNNIRWWGKTQSTKRYV